MPGDWLIQLRLAGQSEPFRIRPYPELKRDAMYWSYVARSRARWTGISAERRDSPVRQFLNDAQLQAIARAGDIEVEIPWFSEEHGWEARVLPWEYLLSQATKPYRGEDRPLTVTRRLVRPADGQPARAVSLAHVGIVQSAPERLTQWYDVKGEGDMVVQALGLEPHTHEETIERLTDPARTSLQEWIAARSRTVLHVAGVDTHQAIDLLELEREIPASGRRDGLAMRGASASIPDFVAADDLARLLCGPHPPQLVFYNFYNSASRIAALTVAQGAQYAIGYQDTIDDALAAVFLGAFYRALTQNGGDIHAAFKEALATLRTRPQKLRGAGIVLWSAASLLTRRDQARALHSRRSRLKAVEDTDERDRISVICKPHELVNYSQLHNRRSLFKELTICRKPVTGPIRNIEVSVTLHLGDEISRPFVKTITLEEDQTSLPIGDEVVVPLTSSLIRTRSERMQSSLQVCVRCGQACVFQETYRVLLAPVDEWQDGKREDWQWLPSFVLPRDPAVARIIESAQRYLIALADDTGAGFDGYQSVDDANAPGGHDDPVDAQVRAIWHALLQEHTVSYINPPPSYGRLTQRLRMPSQVLSERRGTCIDLALLLAACLEYVDVYPVIFLLEGHAFPGYWRSERAHAEFQAVSADQFLQVEADATEQAMRSTAAAERQAGFVLDRSNFDEIRQQLYQNRLVPLETVWLTNHSSFASAMEEGRSNLRNRTEFEAMVDIKLARDGQVTPVPLLWSPA